MRRFVLLLAIVGAVVVAWLAPRVMGQSRQPAGFAAVPGENGGQDIFGAYEIVPNWPKPISSLPGHEKWTWGAGQSVFAESPNRVFILQRGELPNIQRPQTIKLPQLGPNIEFPNFRLPWRDATVASPPGRLEKSPGVPGDDLDVGQPGVDYRWEHWIVDDYRHSIFIFSHDGKQLLQTIGEPNVHAADDKHFYRPTFIAWLPDGTFFVADGYANTRVVKFDKNGKYRSEDH